MPLIRFTFGAFSACSRMRVSRKPRFGEVGVGTRTGDTAACRACRAAIGGVRERAALRFVLPAAVRARRLPMPSAVRAVGDEGSAAARAGLPPLPAAARAGLEGLGIEVDLLLLDNITARSPAHQDFDAASLPCRYGTRYAAASIAVPTLPVHSYTIHR